MKRPLLQLRVSASWATPPCQLAAQVRQRLISAAHSVAYAFAVHHPQAGQLIGQRSPASSTASLGPPGHHLQAQVLLKSIEVAITVQQPKAID